MTVKNFCENFYLIENIFSLIGILKVSQKVNILRTSSDKENIINVYVQKKIKRMFRIENKISEELVNH